MNTRILITVAAFIIFGAVGFAKDGPISKGSFQIGGGATYISLKNDSFGAGDSSLSIILVSPTVAYFPTDRLSVGAQFLLGSVELYGESVSATAIGPQLTYYFGPLATEGRYRGRTNPYLTAGAIFGTLSMENEDEITARAYNVGIGAITMLARNITIYFQGNDSFDRITIVDRRDLFGQDEKIETHYDGNRLTFEIGLRLFVW